MRAHTSEMQQGVNTGFLTCALETGAWSWQRPQLVIKNKFLVPPQKKSLFFFFSFYRLYQTVKTTLWATVHVANFTIVSTFIRFSVFTRLYRALRPTLHGAPRECSPAGFLSHRQSGRRSVSLMSCGWCSCHSSSAGHGSTSHSSSWACFSSCPTSERPKITAKSR